MQKIRANNYPRKVHSNTHASHELASALRGAGAVPGQRGRTMFEIARNSTGLTEGRNPLQSEGEARAVALALATKHGEAFQLRDATGLIDVIDPARPNREIEADIEKMEDAVAKLRVTFFTTNHYEEQFEAAAKRVTKELGASCIRLSPITGGDRQGRLDMFKFQFQSFRNGFIGGASVTLPLDVSP